MQKMLRRVSGPWIGNQLGRSDRRQQINPRQFEMLHPYIPRLLLLLPHPRTLSNIWQTYYFELIGQTNSFGLTAISSALQLISNIVAVCLSDVIPRRKGLIGGGMLLMLWSVVIAGCSMAPESNISAATALLAFMVSNHPCTASVRLETCTDEFILSF